MKEINTNVISLMLKRLKIAYLIENNKITIGKAKTDIPTLLGLVIFPFVFVIAMLFVRLFVPIEDFHIKRYSTIAAGAIGAIGVTNLTRLRKKHKDNKSIKIIAPGSITIITDGNKQTFMDKNIQAFTHTTELTDDDSIYKANLFLVDTNNQKYLLLSFYEENKKLALNDLEWFVKAFTSYIGVNTSNAA